MREMIRSREAERLHYIDKNEKHYTALMKQMEILERRVTDHWTENQKDTPQSKDKLILTRVTDKDDIESYLTTLERIMRAYEVDTSRWAFKLAAHWKGTRCLRSAHTGGSTLL